MDLLTVVLPESMHIVLRDIENNYNLTAPIDYPLENIEESGACIDKSIFSCRLDWVEIYKNGTISVQETDKILNAFKTDEPISSLLPQGLNFYVRTIPTMALDITSLDFTKSCEA